jgi:hypothetical protein
MADFIVRVELHNANQSNYDWLHVWMQLYGFVRTITSDTGVDCHLLPAEYRWSGEGDVVSVRTLAYNAAQMTGCSHSSQVFQYVAAAWYLPRVEQSALIPKSALPATTNYLRRFIR